VTTNKLRRELDLLKLRKGLVDCPECGFPSYTAILSRPDPVRMTVRRTEGPSASSEPPEAPRCSLCGRRRLWMKVRGRASP